MPAVSGMLRSFSQAQKKLVRKEFESVEQTALLGLHWQLCKLMSNFFLRNWLRNFTPHQQIPLVSLEHKKSVTACRIFKLYFLLPYFLPCYPSTLHSMVCLMAFWRFSYQHVWWEPGTFSSVCGWESQEGRFKIIAHRYDIWALTKLECC